MVNKFKYLGSVVQQREVTEQISEDVMQCRRMVGVLNKIARKVWFVVNPAASIKPTMSNAGYQKSHVNGMLKDCLRYVKDVHVVSTVYM